MCAEADVRSIPIGTDDEFLIMASDGLLDFVTPQEAAHAVFQQLREDNHGEYPSQTQSKSAASNWAPPSTHDKHTTLQISAVKT